MFETLAYFEKQQTLAFHKVGDIYTDQNHPIHGQLIADLKSISPSKIEAFETRYHYLFGRSGEDRDMDVRKMFFEYEIAGAVARKRLSILGNNIKGKRQKPYDQDDFVCMNVDDHGLVSVNQLRSDHFSLYNKDHAYQLCPCLDQFNSSHWLGLLILHETFKNGRDFKIRLDPLMREPAETFRPYMALMHLYGKKTRLGKDQITAVGRIRSMVGGRTFNFKYSDNRLCVASGKTRSAFHLRRNTKTRMYHY